MKKVLVIAFFSVISGNMLWSAVQGRTKCHGTTVVNVDTSRCSQWYAIEQQAAPGSSPNALARTIPSTANSDSKRAKEDEAQAAASNMQKIEPKPLADRLKNAEFVKLSTIISQTTKKNLEKELKQLDEDISTHNKQIELVKQKSKRWAAATLAGLCFLYIGGKSGLFEYLIERSGRLGELLPSAVIMTCVFPGSRSVESVKEWWHHATSRNQARKDRDAKREDLKNAPSEDRKQKTYHVADPTKDEHQRLVKKFSKNPASFAWIKEKGSNENEVESTNETIIQIRNRKYTTAT